MRRLDFILPDFCRHMWTSDYAKSQWESRFSATAAAITELQWLTVADNLRTCGIARISSEQFQDRLLHFTKRGVEAIPISRETRGKPGYQFATQDYVPDKPFQYCVAFGKNGSARELARAVENEDSQAVGSLLGYPDCCIEFFAESWQRSKSRDAIWPMAKASISLSQLIEDDGRTIRIDGPSLANILLRRLGLRAVFHLPCCFNCLKSIELAERVITVGRDEGFSAEMDWLSEVLHWPMEWSALHGIAEIKTPILKSSTSTDATGELYRVLIAGSVLPREAAKGIGHAYQPPIQSESLVWPIGAFVKPT